MGMQGIYKGKRCIFILISHSSHEILNLSSGLILLKMGSNMQLGCPLNALTCLEFQVSMSHISD